MLFLQVGTELVEALRQCDGHRLQCLLMVRDDFWLASETQQRNEIDARQTAGA